MDDDLPQKMCLDCLKQVNSSIKFRAKCKETEEKLYKMKIEVEKTYSINNNQYPNREQMKCSEGRIIEMKHEKLEGIKTANIKTECNKSFAGDDSDKPLNYLLNLHGESVQNDYVNECNNGTHRDTVSLNLIKNGYRTIDFEPGKAVKNDLKINDNYKENERDSCDDNMDRININMHNIEYSLCDNINISENQNIKVNIPSLYEIDINSQGGKRVTCKLCQKNLSIRSIELHLSRSHPGADGRRVKCRLCDSFIIKENMAQHRHQMHGSETFQCRYCKLKFVMEDQLIEHIVTCIAKKKRKMSETGREMTECDVCHKSMQKASLRLHKAIKHAGLGPVCEHCGKTFGNKFRLIEHYRAKHGYEKFKCSYCDYQSANLLAMRNHERRHRGEKPFVCESCGAKFHAAYLLAQHRQSHRTDRPYKCEACGARCKTNNALHAHRRARHASPAGRRSARRRQPINE